MFFFSISLAWIICFFSSLHSLVVSAVAEVEVSSPPVSSRPQATNFDNIDLTAALPPASNTQSPVSALPFNCAKNSPAECATTLTATAVTYEDCGDPFIICHCDNATMTMDTAVDRLGRLPVGLRRFIGTIFIFGGDTRAYTLTSGDMHFFGDCAMDTWIHEATHAFDFAQSPNISGSAAWAQAIADDSCVSDTYATRNQVEDFAQTSVIKIYALLHSGHLPPGFQTECMSHQLNFMAALPIYNATSLFGNTCRLQDGVSGTRHSRAPSALDASRAFKTVPLDPDPWPSPSAAVVSVENSASGAYLYLRFGFRIAAAALSVSIVAMI